ncbi:hypothetical protein HK097_007529 [Rhizophlyctis rosea]|uniref:Uncharacterized protein n=1 Tax=Rhizophlyctis rosea TaxID=64517 RepID=A0AAD5SBG8_9FUNG|nr:hypothetical protein HK097_007529 [Rhizophlyctis rosea]
MLSHTVLSVLVSTLLLVSPSAAYHDPMSAAVDLSSFLTCRCSSKFTPLADRHLSCIQASKNLDTQIKANALRTHNIYKCVCDKPEESWGKQEEFAECFQRFKIKEGKEDGEGVKKKAEEVKEGVKEKVQEVKEKAEEVVSEVEEAVESAVESVKERVEEVVKEEL